MLSIVAPDGIRPYMLNTGLYALSGGVTNWLAIHMLFERIPGLYGSGVIQLRFEEFKIGIRQLIMEQFFDKADLSVLFSDMVAQSDQLKHKLGDSINNLDLDAAFESLLDVIMNSSFSSMLGMIGGRDALTALREPFVAKMRAYLRDNFVEQGFSDKLQGAISAALDDGALRSKLEELIDDRLNQMTPPMVKEIVQDMIRKHLGWLVVWGCAFGGIIGLLVTFLRLS